MNIPISKLKPNTGQITGLPKNPRFIRDERFEQLKKSLADLPMMTELRELLVVPQNGHYVTLGGNMRLRAAKDLGWKEMPCKILPEDTPVKTLAEIVVKDNVPFGQDDFDILANEWTDFPLTDWGMEGLDFEVEEEPKDAEPQIDKAAELNKKWKVKTGDLWQIGEHRLLCGTATDKQVVSFVMRGGRADLVFTDPPYNVQIDYGKHKDDFCDDEYRTFTVNWFTNAREICNQVLFTSGLGRGMGMPNLQMWYDLFRPDWMLIWVKTNALQHSSLGGFNNWEPILFYGKPKHIVPQDIFDIPITVQQDVADENGKKLHPTPKSQKLWSTLIDLLTDAGDVCFEPFAGSGTTLVACQNLNRKCYAIEISENYCAVILERMATAFPELEIKRET